ncbi:hypothetical protein KAJ02_07590, partial [Candidatus Bipolaricaulota bacterium]|nr:hypothetical protein [Candidatus Bipolaricaulota bacterium]
AAEDWTQLTRTHILAPSNADVWHLVPNSVERLVYAAVRKLRRTDVRSRQFALTSSRKDR